MKIINFLIIILVFSTSCTRHRNPSSTSTKTQKREIRSTSEKHSSRGKTTIKMRKEYGVYYVPCNINGTEMEFIFDTGASDITMSLTEAIFLLKQGKLLEEDIKGTQQYQIADGSVHEGAIVVLRSVQIGNRELSNIQASIVDNMEAPLLLGQSALSKFGKISIDYNKNEIIFE